MSKFKPRITDDFVFKRVFTKDGNEHILKDFLEAVLDLEINTIEVKNTELTKDRKDGKTEILDVRAVINGDTLINVEMQNQGNKHMIKRATIYNSKMYAEQLKKGENYDKALKAKSIIILNYNMLKIGDYHNVQKQKIESIHKIEHKEVTVEQQEIHYIELPKFRNISKGIKTKKEQWLWVFCQEEEMIKMAEKVNMTIAEVIELLDKMSEENEYERRLYDQKMFEEMDRQCEYETALEIGEERGLKKRNKRGKNAAEEKKEKEYGRKTGEKMR